MYHRNFTLQHDRKAGMFPNGKCSGFKVLRSDCAIQHVLESPVRDRYLRNEIQKPLVQLHACTLYVHISTFRLYTKVCPQIPCPRTVINEYNLVQAVTESRLHAVVILRECRAWRQVIIHTLCHRKSYVLDVGIFERPSIRQKIAPNIVVMEDRKEKGIVCLRKKLMSHSEAFSGPVSPCTFLLFIPTSIPARCCICVLGVQPVDWLAGCAGRGESSPLSALVCFTIGVLGVPYQISNRRLPACRFRLYRQP